GNAENVRAEELREKAWSLVSPALEESRRDLVERFSNDESRGWASKEVVALMRAASEGRIATLLYAPTAEVWGLQTEPGVLIHSEPETGDDDLVNEVAVRTLLTEGEVRACPPDELPGGAPMAAIFRYPDPTGKEGRPADTKRRETPENRSATMTQETGPRRPAR